MSQLVLGIIPVMVLMAVNFYLHGRHVAERPANPVLVTLASVLDLAVITSVVIIWPEADYRGLGSPFFIFYLPVIVAFAFVMRPGLTAAFTLAALAAYAGACFLADTAVATEDGVVTLALDPEQLITTASSSWVQWVAWEPTTGVFSGSGAGPL